MTVSRLESDFQPSNMRRTKQGRPTIYPNVTSGHGKRQGARPGSVPYTITKREIKMITMRWDSSFSAHKIVPLPRAKILTNKIHNLKNDVTEKNYYNSLKHFSLITLPLKLKNSVHLFARDKVLHIS